jgi:hypothetical protein
MDKTTLRIVATALAMVVIIGLLCLTWLVYRGAEANAIAVIAPIPVGALGALGSLLVSGSIVHKKPDPVAEEKASGTGA